MPWEETSPGRFERSLDPSEAFFQTLGAIPRPPGRERWGLTAVAQFKTDMSHDEIPQALRQAWKSMRYQFPMLAATLEPTRKVYEVPGEKELESWLDQTIVVEPADADADTIIGTYQSTPLSKLHYLPGSSELLFHTSHWRTDGIGLCLLMNSLFKALANPRDVTFGDEGKRLSPSIEEAAGVCEITEEKKQMVQDKWKKGLQGGRSIALPIKGLAISAGTYRKSRALSETATSAIVAACKKRGVSVTTAITAALAANTRQHEGPEGNPPGLRMTFLPYFNLRSHMPPPFKSEEHPLTMMVVSEGINIELLDFEDSLKQIAPFYSQDLSIASGSDMIPLVGAWNQFHIAMYTPAPKPAAPAAGAPAAPAAAPLKPATTPSLNSMGVLDQYIAPVHQGQHNFEVMDFRFTVEILGPVLLCYAWTFRGKLWLTQFYNEAFFAPEYVQKILDSLTTMLLEKLEVSE